MIYKINNNEMPVYKKITKEIKQNPIKICNMPTIFSFHPFSNSSKKKKKNPVFDSGAAISPR